MEKELYQFAELLAAESGRVIRPFFRSKLQIENKTDASPVTIADRKAEEVMRTLINSHYPDHGIIGEEFGEENPDADYVWILDPIDGTKSFICGALSFGTLIGLRYKGEAVLGVFHQPILNELMIGDNNKTTLNGEITRVRECTSLSDAVLLTTDYRQIGKYRNPGGFDTLLDTVKLFRMWGDCYGYYLLSSGFADIMIDPIMHLWDTFALVPIVRGAGGIITDYYGNDPLAGDSTVASAPGIHKSVIAMLNPE